MNRKRARIEAWNNLPNYPSNYRWLNAHIVSPKHGSKYTRTRNGGIGVVPVVGLSPNGTTHRFRA